MLLLGLIFLLLGLFFSFSAPVLVAGGLPAGTVYLAVFGVTIAAQIVGIVQALTATRYSVWSLVMDVAWLTWLSLWFRALLIVAGA